MDIQVLTKLSYGMYAVCADDNGQPKGCIVNTVIQVTAENPVLAVSINKQNYTMEVIERTKKFSICILSEKSSRETIGQLGFFSGRDKNKFEKVAYKTIEDRLPIVIDQCCGYILCEMLGISETDTHYVVIAKVTNTIDGVPEPPMTYQYYHEVVKGKAPKNAPTYVAPEKPKPKETLQKRYVCPICGFVYEGDIENEPDSYVCPICKASKAKFLPKE